MSILIEYWQWYADLDAKSKLLSVIGIAIVYVGWKIIKLMWPSGVHEYTGPYDDEGLYHGQDGFLQCSNGDVYKGDFVHGRMHGHGHYVFKSGGSYKGEFRDGRFNGRGVETYKDKSEYEGEFVSGVRMGTGRMKYPNGATYDGEWQMGRKHGKGVAVLANGTRFEGQYVKGAKHGRGKHSSENGKRWLKGVWERGRLVKTISKHDPEGGES